MDIRNRYLNEGHYLQTDKCKDPELEVERRLQKLLDREFLWDCIISVFVDTTDYKITFLYVEEFPGFMGVIGKIDEQEICKEGDCACNLWYAYIIIRVFIAGKRGRGFRGAVLSVQRQITHNTLHNEDPLPAVSAANTIHLHEAVGKDTAECIGEASYYIERAIPFADIVW